MPIISISRCPRADLFEDYSTPTWLERLSRVFAACCEKWGVYGYACSASDSTGPPFYHLSHQERVSMSSSSFLEVSVQVWCAQGDSLYRSIHAKRSGKTVLYTSCVCGFCAIRPVSMSPPLSSANFPGLEDSSWPPFLAQSVGSSHAVVISARVSTDRQTQLDVADFFAQSVFDFPSAFSTDHVAARQDHSGISLSSTIQSACVQAVYQLGLSRVLCPTQLFVRGAESKGVLIAHTDQSRPLELKQTLPKVYRSPADLQPLQPVRRGARLVASHTSTHEIQISAGEYSASQLSPPLAQPRLLVWTPTLSISSVPATQPHCTVPPGVQFGSRTVAAASWRKAYLSEAIYAHSVFGHVHEPLQSLRLVLAGTMQALDATPKPSELFNLSTSLILRSTGSVADVSAPSFASLCLARAVMSKVLEQELSVFSVIDYLGFLPPVPIAIDPASSPSSFSLAMLLSWFVAVENYNLINANISTHACRMRVEVDASLSPKTKDLQPEFPQIAPKQKLLQPHVASLFNQHEAVNLLASTSEHTAFCVCSDKNEQDQSKSLGLLYGTSRHPLCQSTSRLYGVINTAKSNLQDCTPILQPWISSSLSRIARNFTGNSSMLQLQPSVLSVESLGSRVIASLSRASLYHQAFFYPSNIRITPQNTFCGNLTERFVALVQGLAATMHIASKPDEPLSPSKSPTGKKETRAYEQNLTLADLHCLWDAFLSVIEQHGKDSLLLPYLPVYTLTYKRDLQSMHQQQQFFQGCILAKRLSSMQQRATKEDCCASETETALYISENLHAQQDRHSIQCRNVQSVCVCSLLPCTEPLLADVASEKLHSGLLESTAVMGADDADVDISSDVEEEEEDTDTVLNDFEDGPSVFTVHMHSTCSSVYRSKNQSSFITDTLYDTAIMPGVGGVLFPSVRHEIRQSVSRLPGAPYTELLCPVQPLYVPAPTFFHQFSTPPSTLRNEDLTDTLLPTLGCSQQQDMTAFICANWGGSSAAPFFDFVSFYLGLPDARSVFRGASSFTVEIIRKTRKTQEIVSLQGTLSKQHIELVQQLQHSTLPSGLRLHHTNCSVPSIKATDSKDNICACCFWTSSWKHAMVKAQQLMLRMTKFNATTTTTIAPSVQPVAAPTNKYEQYIRRAAAEIAPATQSTENNRPLYCPELLEFLFTSPTFWTRQLERGIEYSRQFDLALLLLECAEINSNIQLNSALLSPSNVLLHQGNNSMGLKAIDVYVRQYAEIGKSFAKLHTQLDQAIYNDSKMYRNITADEFVTIARIAEKTETRCSLSHSLLQCTQSRELVDVLVDDSGGCSTEVKDGLLEPVLDTLCRKVVLVERGETTAKVTRATEKRKVLAIFDAGQAEIVTPVLPTLFTTGKLPEVEEPRVNEQAFVYPTCIATSMELKAVDSTQRVLGIAKVDSLPTATHLAVYTE